MKASLEVECAKQRRVALLEGFETACSQTPTHPVSFPLFH